MKVKELIELLQKENPEAIVHKEVRYEGGCECCGPSIEHEPIDGNISGIIGGVLLE